MFVCETIYVCQFLIRIDRLKYEAMRSQINVKKMYVTFIKLIRNTIKKIYVSFIKLIRNPIILKIYVRLWKMYVGFSYAEEWMYKIFLRMQLGSESPFGGGKWLPITSYGFLIA